MFSNLDKCYIVHIRLHLFFTLNIAFLSSLYCSVTCCPLCFCMVSLSDSCPSSPLQIKPTLDTTHRESDKCHLSSYSFLAWPYLPLTELSELQSPEYCHFLPYPQTFCTVIYILFIMIYFFKSTYNNSYFY